MASLKEIKRRITSVKNIWKITSAMRMIASAKLHRAQNAVTNIQPYEQRLLEMLSAIITPDEAILSPYTRKREEIKRVAMVAFSSNSSLCGAFNMNVVKRLNATIREKYSDLSQDDILIFPVGRKIHDALRREGYKPQGDFRKMVEKPKFEDAATLARTLMELFVTHQVDRIVLVYNHYKNMVVQISTAKVFLPVPLEEVNQIKKEGKWKITSDFLFEPSREKLIALLLPKVLELKIFSVLLDSIAAEHAARTVAMQLASDNASDLLEELRLNYNKLRQQQITSELLDIVGGSFA
jgi:F-type H+-transporting ATPase subunit gamma